MKPGTIIAGLFLCLFGGALMTVGIAAVGAWSALVIPGAAVGFWGGYIVGEGLGW